MKHKGFSSLISIFLALGLILIGGVAWYFEGIKQSNVVLKELTVTSTQGLQERANSIQNSQVDTSLWRTYTDAKYGFSFQYPKTFDLVDHRDTNSLMLYPKPQPIEFGPYMYIGVSKITSNNLVDATKEMFGKNLVSYNYKTIDNKKYFYITANEYVVGPDEIQKNEYYLIQLANSKILKIHYSQFYKEHLNEYLTIIGSIVVN